MTDKLCLGSNRVVVSTYTEATGRDLNNLKLKGRNEMVLATACCARRVRVYSQQEKAKKIKEQVKGSKN